MACKLFRNVVVLSLIALTVIFLINGVSAAEPRPQRRRRPSTTTESDSEVSSAPVFPPRFLHQRRMNAKQQALNKQEKSLQSDIAESCKSEPGCEWSCSETDIYDCLCRCKFDPATFNLKNQNARFH